MAFLNAPKTAHDAQEMMKEVPAEELANLSGIQLIIHHLKKKEWGEMVGAIMALWTEYFGSDDEKAKLAKDRKEYEQEQTRQETKDELASLHEEVEEGEEVTEDAEKEEPEEEQMKEEAEVLPGTDTLLIGDSIAHGFQGTFAKGERPNFIGKDGLASFKTLARLRRAKKVLDGEESEIKDPDDLKQAKLDAQKLKGPRKAIIYTGGNNVGYSSPEKIIRDMVDMAQICKSAGIKEIVVCTRFPIDPRRAEKMGDKYPKRRERSAALRKRLIAAVESGEFPDGVKLVDLYKQYADENGMLKEEYVAHNSSDTLHPRKAYRSAVATIQSRTA